MSTIKSFTLGSSDALRDLADYIANINLANHGGHGCADARDQALLAAALRSTAAKMERFSSRLRDTQSDEVTENQG